MTETEKKKRTGKNVAPRGTEERAQQARVSAWYAAKAKGETASLSDWLKAQGF